MESLRAKAAHKHKASAPTRRNWARRWFAIEVSRHDIAGIWVAFFQESQRCRCAQACVCNFTKPTEELPSLLKVRFLTEI